MAGDQLSAEWGVFRPDFATHRLADLCDPTAGVLTGPFGSQLHREDYVREGTPIITVEHLGANRILHEDVPRVSEADRARLSRYSLRVGDIVFSRVGSVDRSALVRGAEDGWLFSGRCLRVRPAPDRIDAEYLSYLFQLPAFKEHVRAIAVGATMPSLNTSLLSNVVVPHPRDLAEQRAIAHILGTLDDKIELNRRMNETLEAIAQALFKSWFVDFDPVRAKAAGRSPAGMDAATAALFPDRLVDSELGEIPEGWKVGRLAEAIELNPPRQLSAGAVAPYLDMANMPQRGHTPAMVVPRIFTSGTRFVNGDTLVARITPCLENGKTAYVDFLANGQTGWGSTEFIVLRPVAPLPEEFGYCLARSATFREYAIQSMTGSSGRQRVQSQALLDYRLVVPGAEIAVRFGVLIRPLFARARAATNESDSLSAMRDQLLPALIGGVVRI